MPLATTVASPTKPKFFRWSMCCLVLSSGQMMAPPSQVLPYTCTGKMAVVRGVMAASMRLGSRLSLCGSMSTNTG